MADRYLKLQTGDYLLKQDGDKIVLHDHGIAASPGVLTLSGGTATLILSRTILTDNWIEDSKGEGPWDLTTDEQWDDANTTDGGEWDFTPQPDKWGYLNNPRWSSLVSAQEFCHRMGLSLNTDTHIPCGHWHKNPGIRMRPKFIPHSCPHEVTVYMYGDNPVVPTAMWLDASPFGMLCFIHDYSGRVFFEGEGMVNYSSSDEFSGIHYDDSSKGYYPTIALINPHHFAWASHDYVAGITGTKCISVWIYDHAHIKKRRVLFDDASLNTSGYVYDYTYDWRRSMAYRPDGTIMVCACGEDQAGDNTMVGVAVSSDGGDTFEEVVVSVKDINDYYFYNSCVIVDSAGTFWLQVYNDRILAGGPCTKILFKSTNGGQSWSEVNEVDMRIHDGLVYEDQNTMNPSLFVDVAEGGTALFMVDDALKYDNNPDPAYSIVKKSTDGGLNWTDYTLPFTETRAYTNFGTFAARGNMWLVAIDSGGYNPYAEQYVYRSTDGGSTWNEVLDYSEPFYQGDWGTWGTCKFNNWGDTWVFSQSEIYQYDGNADPDQFIGYFISTDNGATWTWKLTPVSFKFDSKAQMPFYSRTAEVGRPGDGRSDEPVVWEI